MTFMKWNPGLYDNKHHFVSKYGEEVVDLLAPKKGELILDLGCGTGDLSALIAESGAVVTGVDSSAEMIASAREKYPHLDFHLASAQNFELKTQFDAVLSNATLHWVLEAEQAISCIYNHLKKGGRFVAEFGGKGNVNNITSALKNSLRRHGYVDLANTRVWYFPSLSAFAGLLEGRGFRVTMASHFDRPTLLQDQTGIRTWILMFGKRFLEGLSDQKVDIILSEVEDEIEATNYIGRQWYADYVRLRITARK